MARNRDADRKLDKLIAKMREAAQAGDLGLYGKTKTLLAAEALTQVGLGFRESRDPYGATWKPPEHRLGMPLRDTGRLRNSFTARINAGGFVVGTNVKYARIHQNGGVIRAKNGRALRFKVPIQGPAPRGAGGSKAGLGIAFVFVKSVKIPQRRMVPDKGIGLIWRKAFHDAAGDILHRYFVNVGAKK